MEYLKENRRKYFFKNPFDFEFSNHGIKTDGEFISFPKNHPENNGKGRNTFNSVSECKDWIMEYEYNAANFKSMERRDKVFFDIRSKVLNSESEFDKIKPFMLDPDGVSPDEIYVVESNLANNVVDRDVERFSAATLRNLGLSIVGKSKLENHDWGSLGTGTFYESNVVKYTDIQDFKDTLGFTPDNETMSQLEYILEAEKSLQWLMVKYYMPIIDYSKLLDTKARKKFMSIGFRSPVRVDVQHPSDTKRVWFREYQEAKNLKSEALEGSDVFLGSQYGAGRKDFTKSVFVAKSFKELQNEYIENLNDECFAVFEEKEVNGQTETFRHLPHHVNGAKGNDQDVDIPLLKEALANIESIPKELRELAASHLMGHAKNLKLIKENRMILKSKHIGDKEITDDNLQEVVKLFDDKIDELVGEKEAKDAALEIVGEFKSALNLEGDDVDFENVKVILQKSNEFDGLRNDLEGEVVKMAYHSKSVTDQSVESYTETLKEKSIDELRELLKTYREKFASENPKQIKLPWSDVTQPVEPEEKKSTIDVTNYRPDYAYGY